MTTHKHLKARVRTRMHRTGESYTTARRHVLSGHAGSSTDVGRSGSGPRHLPGVNPEAATLRVVLANRGVVAPHTDEPWTEAMLLGLTGGVGLSVFAFRYERDDVSTFFIGARRPDSSDAMTAGLDRLGIRYDVAETTGTRTADRSLREGLAAHGPVAAWVDAATLGTRGMSERWVGGAYHVLAVLDVDDEAGTATVSDLADDPVVVSTEALAASRARIRKQRNRLVAVTGPQAVPLDLRAAVRSAIAACHRGLTQQRMRSLTVDALDDLAERMDGGAGPDSWERMFPAGPQLWTALTSLHEFVEHFGTGGGLLRPLYADFLREAAVAADLPLLDDAARHYDELGRQWTDLARAALPDDVAPLAEARRLQDDKARLYAERGAGALPQLTASHRRLDELGGEAARSFPLDADAASALRADLARRVRAIARGERAAVDLLGRVGDL